jgi:outer membrane murein-binding lipoprotein Lpp
MSIVKGSRQDELVIEHRRIGHRLRSSLYLIMIIAIVSVGGYLGGYYDSRSQLQQLSVQKQFLEHNLSQAEETIQNLSQRVSVLEKGGEVDRKAAESFRQTVRELNAEVARLEQEVGFYKGIMAPGSADRGLRISKIDIQAAESPQNFRYTIMLTQVVDNSAHIEGQAAINIVGQIDGKTSVLPLRDIDSSIDDLGIKFRFRYFQEIKGELTLPDGFVPEQMQVVLQSSGNQPQRVEETQRWFILGETHVQQ